VVTGVVVAFVGPVALTAVVAATAAAAVPIAVTAVVPHLCWNSCNHYCCCGCCCCGRFLS